MPLIPPPALTAYDTVNTVLNMARGRLNDELKTLQPMSGKLLDTNQAFAQQTFNTAYRKCQAWLAEKGYARLINEIIVSAIPVVASLDPAAQCWLSWAGFFDGVSLFPSVALPSGFNHPLKIWERWSGQNAQFMDPGMEKFLDGIPTLNKTTAMMFWEWRNDAIYTPGSLIAEDLRIRYVGFLPDIVDVSGNPWFIQPVPIVRIADGLSWYVVAELSGARDGTGNPVELACMAKGEQELMRVFNLAVKADQRVNVRRQARTGRGFGRSWY